MTPMPRAVLPLALLACSLTATVAAAPNKSEILDLARERAAGLPWGETATYVVKPGVGGVLSRWIVVVSCATCDVADEGVVVFAYDREGKANCAAPAGTFVCGGRDKLDGAEANQRVNVTDARGTRVGVIERYRSGRARVITIEVSPRR